MQTAAAMRWLRVAIAVLLMSAVVGMAVITDEDPLPAAEPKSAQTTTIETVPPVETTTTTTTPPVVATAPPTTEPRFTSGRKTYTGPVTAIAGRVLDGDGRPVRGAEVLVTEYNGPWEGFAKGLLFAVSLGLFGLVCLGDPPLDCGDSGKAVTDADGRYTIRVFASLEDVRSVGELDLMAQSGGTTARVRLDPLPSARFAAPDLKLWFPNLRFDDKGATWRPPPEEAEQTLSFVESDRTEFAREGDGRVEFEPRVLEDFNGFAAVRAETGRLSWISPRVPYRGPGVPFSRNKPCTITAEKEGQPPTRFDNCPITDKDDKRLPGRHGKELVVDLGTTRRVSLAVVRGFPDDFTIEVSKDGVAWVEAMRHDSGGGNDVVLAYAKAPVDGRYVRVRIDSWNFWFMERLSVW